jgi:cobalamin biosynthetic protein CobC
LREAARRHGIAPGRWLDLSTGINPEAWPCPPLPPDCWHRLPEGGDGLEEAACAYLGASHVLPVAGSQAAIQALPLLRPHGKVAVPCPGYAEHAAAWARAGHAVIQVLPETQAIEAILPQADTLVLINPNNPAGQAFSRQMLLSWHARLARKGGWLVVDEAFIDATPEGSLCRESHAEGLVVLRSLGKFFGLAGARVGFACAAPALLSRLEALLGPWPIAAPARRIAAAALKDRAWQALARKQLPEKSARLAALLARFGLAPAGGTALFQWVRTQNAEEIYEALAQQAVLVRWFAQPKSLRFGLPGNEAEWARLEAALASPACATALQPTKETP